MPISSSAHLAILPYLFSWTYQGLVYDVALHFGTLLAILIFFYHDWVSIFKSAFSSARHCNTPVCHSEQSEESPANVGLNLRQAQRSFVPQDDTKDKYPKDLLWILLIGTIPGAIAGVLLEKEAESLFRSPLLIAINLLVFGLIIWLVDKHTKTNYKIANISWKQGLLVGLAQMLAIVPGVSRSGSTMAAGRVLGLNRQSAARFSFLLAAPIMLGSALFEARHFTTELVGAPFILAFLTSLIFGWLAIKYLLKYLERGSFGVFAVYRAVLAVIVIAVYLLR